MGPILKLLSLRCVPKEIYSVPQTKQPMKNKNRKNARIRLSRKEREQQIIDGAVRYFAEVGFGGQTRELARRLGISQSLLFRYFPTKDDIVKRVYEEENNFKYDCVIKARFDLGRINRATSGPGKINPYACQCIKFDPN